MANMIQDYLDQFQAALPRSMGRRQRTRLLCEIEDHLLESWEAKQARDVPKEDAQHLVLEHFGSPVALAWEFVRLDALRKRRMVRICLFAGLIVFLLSVVSSLFRYPASSGMPTILALNSLLCGGIVCLYWWAGIQGTRLATPAEVVGSWQGMKASLLFGALLAVTSVASILLTSFLWGGGALLFPHQSLTGLDHLINACSTGVALFVWLGATAWYSASATYETRRVTISIQVGFWSGLMASLIMALMGLLEYYLFLNLTLHTSWPHDTICVGSHNLAACEMGDLLGGIATMVLLLPCLGVLLGGFAGFIGREAWRASPSSRQARNPSLVASRRETMGSPLIVCGILLALFLIGMLTNLW